MKYASAISNEEREFRKLASAKHPIEELLRRHCNTVAFATRIRQLFEAA
jgi:hypothetical protein